MRRLTDRCLYRIYQVLHLYWIGDILTTGTSFSRNSSSSRGRNLRWSGHPYIRLMCEFCTLSRESGVQRGRRRWEGGERRLERVCFENWLTDWVILIIWNWIFEWRKGSQWAGESFVVYNIISRLYFSTNVQALLRLIFKEKTIRSKQDLIYTKLRDKKQFNVVRISIWYLLNIPTIA